MKVSVETAVGFSHVVLQAEVNRLQSLFCSTFACYDQHNMFDQFLGLSFPPNLAQDLTTNPYVEIVINKKKFK